MASHENIPILCFSFVAQQQRDSASQATINQQLGSQNAADKTYG
jgi:hypothetical protein